ncbi:sigma-70 family RNA polymerase sigma factor [bacterium]|nr:sigma-70 family RNA polymerase sigma factor [bacterium]
MLALQGGDPDAFRQLVERHQSSLIGFFIRHLRDAQLAEDLSQETLLRVYNTAWDYLPRGAFRGWMYRIARNLLIDNTRKRSHDALVRAVKTRNSEGEDGLDRIAGESSAPANQAFQAEVVRAVTEVLPLLPQEQRMTFQMYHYDGLSLPEIADAMESNLPTTKSRLRLAREKLRDFLQQKGFHDPGLDASNEDDNTQTVRRK